MVMTIQSLIHSLKSHSLRPVYLILGRQNYWMTLIRKKFYSLIPTANQAMNTVEYDLNTDHLDSVLNDAVSAPFFGRHRLILVKNPYFLIGRRVRPINRTSVEHLIYYLQNPLSSTILVIFAPYRKLDRRKKVVKVLQKRSVVVDLNHLPESLSQTYVQTQIRRSGYEIDKKAMDLLIQRTGGQLSKMMSALPKLMLDCRLTKIISLATVDALVTKSLSQNGFDLVNYVAQGQVTQAITLYHELLLAGQSPLKINAILVSQFRLLLQVRILLQRKYSKMAMSQALRVHPYRIGLTIQMVNRFTLRQLVFADLALIRVERRLKLTNQSPELLFETFMIEFTTKKMAKLS